MDIQYFKLISGEDVVAQVEDFDETSETITLLQPFQISIEKIRGYHQYTAYRWNVFIDEKYEDKVSIKRNMIVFSGTPNDYILEMYENWIKEEVNSMNEDLSEILMELNSEYLKKVH